MNIQEFFNGLEPITTTLIGALLIIIVGFVLGRVLGLIVKRLLKGVKLDANIRKATGYRVAVESLIAGIVSVLVYVVTVIMALNYLGLTTAILTIIVAAIIIILAFSFLLAIRDLLPNMIAGLTMMFRKDLSEGARIRIRGVEGEISAISLLSTTIDTHGDTIIVPNALFLKEGYHIKK